MHSGNSASDDSVTGNSEATDSATAGPIAEIPAAEIPAAEIPAAEIPAVSRPDAAVIQQPAVAVGQGSDPNNHADGWIRTSGRVMRRTTDVLVIALVCMGLYAVGDQVAGWWRAPQPDNVGSAPTELPPADWDLSSSAVELQFGDRPVVVSRTSFQCAPQEALDRLQEHCLTWTRQATFGAQQRPLRERRLTQLLTTHAPTLIDGDLRIYRFNAAQVVAIGVRTIETASETTTPAATDAIGCWAVLLPETETRWTVLGFRASEHGATVSGLPLKVPAAAHPTIRIGQPGHISLQGFDGSGPAESWVDDIDGQLAALGFEQINARQPRDGALAIRWTKPHDEHAPLVELLIDTQPGGSCHGLLSVTPIILSPPTTPSP